MVLLLSAGIINFVFMKAKKKLHGAVTLGVKVRQDKSLDKLSGKILFPEKLKLANEVVSRLKWKTI